MINIATATKTNEKTIHDWSMVIDNMTKVINPMIDVDCDDNPAICTHFQDGEDLGFGVEFAARIRYCPMCGRKLSEVA